jgi:hypothetical protein
MEIHSSDEEQAMAYQSLELDRLNEILKNNGIDDKAVRQQICSDYLMDSGYFLDAGWFRHGDIKLYPQLCFAERDPETSEITILHAPLDGYDLHDTAYGTINEYFDEGDETIDIETGSGLADE